MTREDKELDRELEDLRRRANKAGRAAVMRSAIVSALNSKVRSVRREHEATADILRLSEELDQLPRGSIDMTSSSSLIGFIGRGLQSGYEWLKRRADRLTTRNAELRELRRQTRDAQMRAHRQRIKTNQTIAEANRLERQVTQFQRARDEIQRAAADSGIPFPPSAPLYLLILEVYSVGDTDAQRAACRALYIYRNAALDHDPLPGFLRSMGEKWRSLLCSRCFCRFEPLQMKDGDWVTKAVKYYACRQCHRVSSAIEGVGKIVMVIDRSMTEPYALSSGVLLVNWLVHKETFDFEEVLIRNADDAGIEELAMKVRNDPDTKRRKLYRSVPVYMSPAVHLSQAKLNLLKDTFGRIQSKSSQPD